MMQLSAEARNLNWLVSNFVERVPGVKEATVVSSDGLLIALSDGLDRSSRRPSRRGVGRPPQHRQGRCGADRRRARARGHRRDGRGDALRDAGQRHVGARGHHGAPLRRRARRLRDGRAGREVRRARSTPALVSELQTVAAAIGDPMSGGEPAGRPGPPGPQAPEPDVPRPLGACVRTCSRAGARRRRSACSRCTRRCSR